MRLVKRPVHPQSLLGLVNGLPSRLPLLLLYFSRACLVNGYRHGRLRFSKQQINCLAHEVLVNGLPSRPPPACFPSSAAPVRGPPASLPVLRLSLLRLQLSIAHPVGGHTRQVR